MASRRELKSIASGLLDSFISRNNDVGGYWGIGKLCLHAQDNATSTVKLDLLSQMVFPESAEFSKLMEGYDLLLQRHLAARNIPNSWVASTIIELEFSPSEEPEKQIPVITWGSLFKLSVAIWDDRGKKYAVSAYSYCAPHDSKKEHRSVGQRF
ncbi:hypothetical protein GJ699_19975 [Duganella sp. FT80W]|uniref:Uncharacterized protein n=1 Tax=Duganella guangzhouensis TaxID=2666084 RepID=A0A6I2L515_9BURK|nr:hypothetical protein [Duganella guangzhouensis]MRW92277.1 hypothetical protein [Duganella guangzhouensis]